MNIRPATLENKHGILEITKQLYLEIPNFVWNTDAYVTRQITNGEYFVGEEEGSVVAIISVRQRHQSIYIETLAVTPARRSDGLGTKLIEFAKEYTKARGFNSLRACAFLEYGNQNFYEKKGFFLVGKPGTYSGHKFYRFEYKL